MKKPTVIHPILLAIFPAWFLYSRNTDKVSIGEVFLPMIVILVVAILVWLIFRLLLGNGIKAGLITSLLIFLNFSYGHTYGLLDRIGPWSYDIRWHVYLIMSSVLIFILILFLVWRTREKLWKLTRIINTISLFLIAVPAVSVIYQLSLHSEKGIRGGAETINFDAMLQSPDIYYIILDGYGRADILDDLYGYDNGEFLDYLSKNDFFVAEKSWSNYAQTYLSLASSLNFTYLDDLAHRPISQSAKARILIDMIKKSRMAKILKESGYSTVAFSSGYSGTEIRNADFFVSPRWALSEFQAVLVSGTLISVLIEKISARTSVPYNLHRGRILFTFDKIPEVAEMETPIFVFAHILAPHPPFVFDEKGQDVNPERVFALDDGSHFMNRGGSDEYIKSYKDQLIYINSLLKKTIESILSESEQPPVIILQADHGPGSRLDWGDPENTDFAERMGILNAVYLPGGGSSGLYNEITPVNTFRIVLNNLFGTELPILEDRSYFSTMGRPYEFIDVTRRTDSDTSSLDAPSNY